MKKKALKTAVVLLVLGGGYLYGLCLLQDRFIFFPDRFYVSPAIAGVPQFEEKPFLSTDGAEIMSWYFKGNDDKPALLFFHGNAGQIATFAPKMINYVLAGYPVLMAEYRGFGTTPGKLSQSAMYDDALAAYDFLQNELGQSEIVVFGYSMGTAAASAAAAQRPAAGLILAAPFYSLARVVGEKPVPGAKLVLKNELPSYRFVEKFAAPLLIVHGDNDRLIPPHHGQDLFNLSKAADKEFKLIPGESHNGLFFDLGNHRIMLEWLRRHYSAGGTAK